MLELDSIANNIAPSPFITKILSMIAEIQHELCRLEHEMNARIEWKQDERVS